MKKLVIGLVLAAVCGVGVTTWATTNNEGLNRANKTIEVTPVESEQVSNTLNNDTKRTEIEDYINNKYGSNWASHLYTNNGEDWDDILEDELELKFGEKYDDLIENIIELKEREAGLDINDLDDIFDNDDDSDDLDDKYDNDDLNDMDDDCDDIRHNNSI